MGCWQESGQSAKAWLRFCGAEEMFRGFLLALPDTREDYGEDRWIGIGMTRGRVAAVAFTQSLDDSVRIISLRKASRYESEQYAKAFQNELEED